MVSPHGIYSKLSVVLGSPPHLTYIDDFLHVIPSRLLTPEETLKTREINQKKFTIFHNWELWAMDVDIWRVVAVTLEKKVAIVVMFTYRVVALSFSSAKNVGRTKMTGLLELFMW